MAKAAKRPARRPKAPARRSRPATAAAQKVAYGSEPGFPISMAMRAGDFVFTSAQADHGFNPPDVVYDERGLVISDGNTLPPQQPAEETGAPCSTSGEPGGAGCGLEGDVVASSAWLESARFAEMNKTYAEFFKRDCPTRSIFRIDFMFDCRIEIKVTAFKPLAAAKRQAAKAKAADGRVRKTRGLDPAPCIH